MKVDWSKVLEAASGDVRRLSHVVRYSSIPISVPENVAEHSYWVSLYAILIHRTLRPKDTTLVAPWTGSAFLRQPARRPAGASAAKAAKSTRDRMGKL